MGLRKELWALYLSWGDKPTMWFKEWPLRHWGTDTKSTPKITKPYAICESPAAAQSRRASEGQEEWRNAFRVGDFTEVVRKNTEHLHLLGHSLLQPLWGSPTFCRGCQIHTGVFSSSQLCHPLPKLCTVQKRMPDFPQALLDVLTAFLRGKRFLHRQHHFYILYNITADDKSILLITHPACYNPHKKHEQLEKPRGDVKS